MTHFELAVSTLKGNLETKMNILNNPDYIEEPKWSVPKKFTEIERDGISTSMGVYKIIHIPTMEIMSIGCGNVGNRRIRHKNVFLNKGMPIIHEGGSSSDSQTALKMYLYDSNIENWAFSWARIWDRDLASIYEAQLIEGLKPKFNNLGMAGK